MIQIPLSREAFQAAATRMRELHAIEIDGDAGVIEKFGARAEYGYVHGVLSVTILAKPFFLSTEQCEQQLRSILEPR